MKLYPYQRTGASWLESHARGGLLDDAGLGKTIQAIVAAHRAGARRIAVVCPAVARANWAREFEQWWTGPQPKLLIDSYDRLADDRARRQQWYDFHPDALVLDEAQYLKSPNAKRTMSLYGARIDGRKCVASGAGAVWPLSATLAPNSVIEYWTHLHALAPELITFGGKVLDEWGFLNRYTVYEMTRFGPRVREHKNEEELRLILRKLFLRRTVEDVLPDLPAWRWDHYTVDAGEAARELLQLESTSPVVEQLRARIEEDLDFNECDAQMAALRKVIGLIKAPLIADLLADELDAESIRKVVVFAHHHAVINKLHERLAEFSPVQLTGKTPEPARIQAIDRFQNDPSCRVFIGQLDACGTAITLHAANHVVFAECSWVPLNNYQAAKRVHRIGQKLPVFVRVFGLHGSIDDAVASTCARKTRLLHRLRIED